MTDAWPWLALAGLGAFHGLNPAMGWLFAVALGLHRQSRSAGAASRSCRSRSGHAVSIAAVAGLLVAAGTGADTARADGRRRSLLIGWAPITGASAIATACASACRSGLLGPGRLVVSDGDGARRRLMLWPALMPLCLPGGEAGAGGPVAAILAGVGIHTLAMVATTAVVAASCSNGWGLPSCAGPG